MVIYFIMFCWMFDMCECIDIYVYEDNVIMLQVSGKCDKTFSFNIKFRHDQTITQLQEKFSGGQRIAIVDSFFNFKKGVVMDIVC